ncbi:MAG: hypothetical protein C0395_08970 [Gemmatimonas sp.]|nr:hypothetical protein [Gemmatimonas sp.]
MEARRDHTGLRVLLGTVALSAALAVGPAAAGIGVGVSSGLTIDTVPPQLTILVAPKHVALRWPETFEFAWTLADDSPAPANDGHQADVVASGTVIASIDLDFLPVDHTWLWTVPEISSGACFLRVTARDSFGNQSVAQDGDFSILMPTTGTPPLAESRLDPPAPNPFNPQTDLTFELARDGRVELTIYDAAGRLTRCLQRGPLPAGSHRRAWDGRDDDGRRVAGGAYLVRLALDGRTLSQRKVVMLP